MQALTSIAQSRRLQLSLLLAIVVILGCWRLIARSDLQNPRIGTAAPALVTDSLDWISITGVTPQQDGIRVQGLERAIVSVNADSYQPHPPYNTASYFELNGDYRLAADFDEQASFIVRFYETLPIVYDEWRYEPASIEVSLLSGVLTVRIWDGDASEPAETVSIPVHSLARRLQVDHIGSKLAIYFNEDEPVVLDDHSILRRGQLWLGLDAVAPWALKQLQLTGLNDGSVSLKKLDTSAPPTASGLKTTAPILIGAAMSLEPLLTNAAYRSLAQTHFSMLVPENALKPQFVQPTQGQFVFNEADQLVTFAKANGMMIHGHTLVFGEANPQWMRQSPLSERQAIMTDHITSVMQHYRGQITAWDVVNEPLADDGSMRDTIWRQAMGDDYIALALRAARAADPDAKLFINEYGLEADGDRWQRLLSLIRQLQVQNVPLDGIGFQAHIYDVQDEVEEAVLFDHMRQLARLGLEVRISEIDVHGEDSTRQAAQYTAVLRACLSADNCKSFTTWGIGDAYGSTTSIQSYPREYGNDLLWDENLQPKTAFAAISEHLAANR
jgi:endo-1,4-beta-xylanase